MAKVMEESGKEFTVDRLTEFVDQPEISPVNTGLVDTAVP